MDNTSELVTGCKIHLVEQINLEDVLTISNSVLFDLQVVKIFGSWKENEVAVFVVFSLKLLIGYFRFG